MRHLHARPAGASGFTLVELLMVGTIAFVLVAGLTLVFARLGGQVWSRTEGSLTSLSDAQRALDRVSEDLRKASQANLVCAPGQLDFDLPDGGPHITYTLDADTGHLMRDDAITPKVVASGIVSFVPTCQAGGLVQLHLMAQSPTSFGALSQPLDSQIWVQNP